MVLRLLVCVVKTQPIKRHIVLRLNGMQITQSGCLIEINSSFYCIVAFLISSFGIYVNAELLKMSFYSLSSLTDICINY
jgi:hypothetical protein